MTEKPEEKSIAKKQQVKQAILKTEYSPETLYISYKNVDIRSGPSTSYDIVGQLKIYETIRGVSEKGWIKCTKEGKIGYIPKSLLKEAGYPLHVKINKFPIEEYSYFNVVGEVINVSEDTFEFVKLEAIYFDGKKNIVDTDFTYACTNDSILPGGVKPFEFTGMSQSDYKSVSVEVKDYDRVIKTEIEHSIVLEGSEIRDVGGRIDQSLIGRDVKIYKCPPKPSVYRLIVGDKSEIGIK